MNNLFGKKKYLYVFLGIILILFVGIGSFFGITAYQDYKAEKMVKNLNFVLDNGTDSIDNCNYILGFKKKQFEENRFFNKYAFDLMHKICDLKYNLNYIELNEENCTNIIKQNKKYYLKDYLIVDNFEQQKKKCINDFLVTKFSTGSLFDVENDFKSNINIDFSLDFFIDIGEIDSDEFIQNRIDAKKRLKNLIKIEPNVDFSIDDIILYNNRGILKLPLLPLTEYKISLKNFDTSIGEQTKNEDFIFTTPENKYFGMKILDKVSLYQDNKPPRFQVLEYNTDITKTKVKICRIPNETYAKIEVFRKQAESKDVKDFFINKIDNLENFDCKEKNINFEDLKNKDNLDLVKKDFNFDDLIGDISRSGLYFVTFSNKEDRKYNGKMNYPIFFGIVDSHVTMKMSRNGEAFFFVNDFEGKPLSNQNIRLYLNDFKEFKKTWNDKNRDYNLTYFDINKTNIFSKEIKIGKTGDDGILRVNLKDEIDNYFSRTFTQNWEYDWEGLYKSFLVTSYSDSNISYVNSTWNAGIAPWNFGYKIGDSYYGNNDDNQDSISLSQYGIIEPDYYSHVYTDRLLYLPGENVNIKGVIRKSLDLTIPENKIVKLTISDSNGKEIHKNDLNINEYGSISTNINLGESAPLGNYNIHLMIDDISIAFGGFSVEVFKNPKFKNDISLITDGLNGGLVTIDKQEKEEHKYWSSTKYFGSFKIKASVLSKYYNGANVANAKYTYKVYKQYYYENSYWDDCYYGCYWEPRKEFYSEGKGVLDGNGIGSFEVDVDFTSNYEDYKYIVEVTVTDNVGDIISGTNSVVAKLPEEFKKYNNNLSIVFQSDNKFIKSGGNIGINGGLNVGKWTTDYNDKYLLVIKKKEYINKEVDDIRGYKRTITGVQEKLEKILLVNDTNFLKTSEGKLRLEYNLDDVGEYVFEYGKINFVKGIDLKNIITDFNDNKILEKEIEIEKEIEVCEKEINKTEKKCEIITRKQKENIKLSDLFSDKKYFTILTYGNTNTNVPIVNDNKIKVIPEKISYNLGETAKVLIRLPFNKGKILWTVEKQGIIEHEYIDVKSNTFFKEINVDDKFIPNAYLGVVAIEVDSNKIPEYRVGYSEIVVDKTDKKAFITVKTDKQEYKPRENVTLDITSKNKSGKPNQTELTVMVVDDSLISLLGNIDLNTLEKFYKKLPFQIQTSITNIAMLRNYYFSRPGIVGGSGFSNFKGGDSAVSSRNIFKNTAYYNPSVITDEQGKATVNFDLPDNLTNFRVMVLSNSKDNLFGYSESFISVRKNVIIEDKTPLILRDGDVSVIGANIFNNTSKEIGFKVELETNIDVADNIRNITIPAGKNKNIYWTIKANSKNKEIPYKITVLGDSAENSDKIENTIIYKESPLLITNIIESSIVDYNEFLDIIIDLPENIDLDKSELELNFSNNKLEGIDKIVNSLAAYPYGCIEQTVSSTLPNVILKRFDNFFSGIIENKEEINKNIEDGVNRIASMQVTDGGFAYWEGSDTSELHISPYVVRSLIRMKESGVKLPEGLLEKSISYLEKNYNNKEITDLEKAEIFWALSYAGKNPSLYLDINNIDRHTLIAYTYGLVLNSNNGNNDQVDANIELIKLKLKDEKYYNRYWNTLGDKAIFASLLIDYDYSRDYTDKIIGELYDNDWSSYYYSTQSKNNAFIAFAKYIENYSKENHTKFTFFVGKYLEKSLLEVGEDFPSIYKKSFVLSDVLKNTKKLGFKTTNLLGNRLYVSYTLKIFPEDKVKIKAQSNGINVNRKIYEVIDENDIKEKCTWNNNKYSCVEPKGLKLVENNIFKKGVLYKTKISVDFEDSKNRRNLVLEDYLPGAFRVINSKFKTEQTLVNQGTLGQWEWDHKEFRPDVVMASASYIWSGGSTFDYFFRPEFEGVYLYPPVTAYMMYNPEIRANSEFSIIEVK